MTGSLTVGKRADVILIRGNDVNVAPLANIETTVVQSATPANVDTVLVDGRIVKRHGKLVAYDVEKVVRDAKASSLRIRTATGRHSGGRGRSWGGNGCGTGLAPTHLPAEDFARQHHAHDLHRSLGNHEAARVAPHLRDRHFRR